MTHPFRLAAALALTATLTLGLTALRAEDKHDDKHHQHKDAEGFVSLFDGKSLDGWEGNPDLWSVQDGVIRGQTKTKMGAPNTFLIYKGDEPANFELRAKFKLTAGNSGIQYRSKIVDPKKWVVGGYQADCDSGNKYTGICYEERGRQIINPRGKKVTLAENNPKPNIEGQTADDKDILAAIKQGDWNEYVITARGNHLTQKINGVTTADFTDNDPAKAATKGVIALQLHAGDPMLVEYKDIKLKKLD